MKDKRFVFDTNSLISAAILPRSVPALALQKAEQQGFLFVSKSTLDEFSEVIQRPKFTKYLSFETRLRFLNQYTALTLCLPITATVTDCRDPKDNKFLDIALAASAHYLITGDTDLLVLHPYHQTQIITPSNFLVLP